jgi:hypothetical protein
VARYVILSHDHPFQHWDLMLEHNGRLRTWRLAATLTPGLVLVPAEALADHRLDYLEYEGPVSGNRGTVVQWDRGEFSWIIDQSNEFQGCLHGERLRGLLVLTRDEGQQWTCVFVPDGSV